MNSRKCCVVGRTLQVTECITRNILAEILQCEENTFLLWNGTFAVHAWGSLVQGRAEGGKDSVRGPEVQQHWDTGIELC